MTGALAYHVVTHAMEAKRGWTPTQRFAASVRHCLNGHLPYQRYYEAGLERRRDGMSEGALERLVEEQLLIDLNPVTQVARNVNQPARLIDGFNAYNQTVNLGVRSKAQGQAASASQLLEQRLQAAQQDDPALCQQGTYFLLAHLLRQVERNAAHQAVPDVMRLSGISHWLGLEATLVHEVSLALEAAGHPLPIAELAWQLGCHQRTLERRLRKIGLTAEMLRQADRLLRATARLRSAASLTDIAVDTGFSDHAHMTRAFKASCGMPPSFFLQLLAPPAGAPLVR